jgi:hypothetical protein
MSCKNPSLASIVDYGPFTLRCKKIPAKNLTVEQKSWLGEVISSKRQLVKDVSKWSGLEVRYLYKLGERASEGLPTSRPVGRPPVYDDESKERLRRFLTLQPKKMTAASESAYHSETAKERQATNLRQGGAGIMLPGTCASTDRKLSVELKIKTTDSAGTTTAARKREEADPRNMVAEAVLLEAFSSGLPADCIINMDAVQYAVGKDGIIQKVRYIKEENNKAELHFNFMFLGDGRRRCAKRCGGVLCRFLGCFMYVTRIECIG